MNGLFKLVGSFLLVMLPAVSVVMPAAIAAELPEDIQWLTNDTDAVFASPEAKKGGTFRDSILSFPATFRSVGPDSNNSFAGVFEAISSG